MKSDVVILGAGIKGATIAALLALAGLRVIVVERGKVAAGSSATNHGRLHAGVASWRSDDTKLMQHRHSASRPLISLLGLERTIPPALYSFEDEQVAHEFEAKCAHAGIPLNKIVAEAASSQWIDKTRSALAVEVAEYPFSPAAMAARGCDVVRYMQGELLLDAALAVEDHADQLLVRLKSGGCLETRLVINALSVWSSDILIPPEFANLEIDRFSWSLLCAPKSALPINLDRIIVSTGFDGNSISLVPHTNWITLDSHDTIVSKIGDPDQVERWRFLDKSNAEHLNLMHLIVEKIPACGSLNLEDVRVVTGVHGRRKNAAPGSRHEIVDVQGRYFVSFGGQASTSLADAIQVANAMTKGGHIEKLSDAERLASLREAHHCAPSFFQGSMIWDKGR